MAEAKLIRLADIPDMPQEYKVACEQAYRRGFTQGYGYAMQNGTHRNVYMQLYFWRLENHCGEMTIPPTAQAAGDALAEYALEFFS